jgi:hypothetical protein
MLEDDKTVPWHFSGSVVIGLDNLYTDSILDDVHGDVTHDKHHENLVFSRDQGEAGDLADESLIADPFSVGPVGLKQRVSVENRLSQQVIEPEADVEIGGGFFQIKMHAGLERSSRLDCRVQCSIAVSKELETL